MTERRFLVDPGSVDAAAGSARIRGAEHHHLRHVLRLRVGDDVSVFDGEGNGYLGVLEEVGPTCSRVALTGADDRAVEPKLRLTLAQGIPRHDRMELIVQKTTEIGVARIVPILAQRSVARPPRGRAWRRVDRWQKVAAEAARQSGRLVVPVIEAPAAWSDFVSNLPEGRRLMLTGRGGGGPVPGDPSAAAVIAVGPEGGWSEQEERLGLEAGFHPISLGPRTLRTETAGIVGVALVLLQAGDLGPGRVL